MDSKPELFIVAGEESANQYVLKLIESFKADAKYKNKNLKFSGIGFKSLEQEEFHLVFDAAQLSVMGLYDVFKKWRTVKKAFNSSIDYILKNKPKAVLLIDFGGFNLKLAEKIKEKDPSIKILYFISPKFWVWGAKRALKVQKYVDEMYVIHPFEVDFYKNWDVQAKFVGHPLLEELSENLYDENWKKQEKIIEDLNPNKKTLGVLLGSRPSEIDRHKVPFTQAVEKVLAVCPEIQVVFIAPPSKSVEDYKSLLSDLSFKFNVLQDSDPIKKMALCDVALVASGTATLQMGLLGVPMAIGYFMNPVTMFVAKRFASGKYAGLVNIVKGKEISKEYLQWGFKPQVVSEELVKLLTDSEYYNKCKVELLSLKKDLGQEKTYERLKVEIGKFI